MSALLPYLGYVGTALGIIFGIGRYREARGMKKALSELTDIVRRLEPNGTGRVAVAANVTNDRHQLRNQLADAIALLPEREKLVITLYYYEQLTDSEIAEVMGGVSTDRITRVREEALRKLQLLVGDEPLKELGS